MCFVRIHHMPNVDVAMNMLEMLFEMLTFFSVLKTRRIGMAKGPEHQV